jgi:hypothetical protein
MAEDLTHERLRELLDYDPATGAMTWRMRPSPNSRRRAGDTAGRPNNAGRWTIGIASRKYRRHRLAWFWMIGRWPYPEIDHIDRNPLNDCWQNLREATRSQNELNKATKARLGIRGVYPTSNGKFRSYLYLNRRYVHLGTFPTLIEAGAARVRADAATWSAA